jgi:vacuolar-type H+-ATPase subunit E/Vma4
VDASEEKLCREIMQDAEKKVQRTRTRAQQDADTLLETVRREIQRQRPDVMAEAQRKAEAQANAVRAGITSEIRRQWLLKQEELLKGAFATAAKMLDAGQGFDPSASLNVLLEEALTALAEPDFRVESRGSGATEALSREQVEAVAARVLPAIGTIEVAEGDRQGVVVRSLDGRKEVDNTYRTRMKRLEPALRTAACAILNTEEPDWNPVG